MREALMGLWVPGRPGPGLNGFDQFFDPSRFDDVVSYDLPHLSSCSKRMGIWCIVCEQK